MHFLLGNSPRSDLSLRRLPSNKEVLKRYFSHKEDPQNPLDNLGARQRSVIGLVKLCQQLELEPRLDRNINKKLIKLIKPQKKICKSKNNKNCLQQPNVIKFSLVLDETFDVSSRADLIARRKKIRNEQIRRRIIREEKTAESTVRYEDHELVSLICNSEDERDAYINDDEIVNAISELLDVKDSDFKKIICLKLSVLSPQVLTRIFS